MKNLLVCFASLLAAGTLLASPPETQSKPRIEVCFVLDTTGSMSGLIEGAKQKIWSIANEMIGAKPTPEIRIGLVGYRDRGDAYVTKVFDLNADIDSIYSDLTKFQAQGGGDTPESVNEALADAVRKMSWSKERSVLKIVFLVGDAPPHMDYQDAPQYPQICQEAMKQDLIINTIQCGNMKDTTPVWQEIAKLAEGSFSAIAQTGNMAVIATPMDAELARLNREIGRTLIAYGSAAQQSSVVAKQSLAEAAAPAAAADRLRFNAASGKAVQGEGELVDAVARGAVKLENIKKDELPEELRKLSSDELKERVEKQQKERSALQAQVADLSKKREDYLAAERKRLAATGKGDAFDEKVATTIREQAARKGIRYEK